MGGNIMKQLGIAIIKSTTEALDLGLDIREVYIQSWGSDKNGIDYVEVIVEHSVEGQDEYATKQFTQRF